MRDFAFYHPWPPLDDRSLDGWVKTMLLFFDGVAFLAPPQFAAQLVERDLQTMAPLAALDQLRILDPQEVINEKAANQILDFLRKVVIEWDDKGMNLFRSIESRYPERQDSIEETALFAEGLIYRSRGLLNNTSREVAEHARVVWNELKRRGLVSGSMSNETINASASFWAAYEAFLAYTLRNAAQSNGLDLHPATDDPRIVNSLVSLLGVSHQPSEGHIVAFDTQRVSVNLSGIPLDEILDFRNTHGSAYRAYSANVRKFAHEIAFLDEGERKRVYRDRQLQLTDAASELARYSRTSWKRPLASVGLGFAGASWSASHGDWVGGAIALLVGIAGAGYQAAPTSAYSYLFQAQGELG